MTGSEGRGRSGKRPSLRGGRDDRGRGDAGAGSGPLALSLWGGEGLAGETQERAQGLWPFRYGEERGAGGGRRAGSRPAAFRYVAGATYSYRKVPAGESASGFPAGIFRYDCAACRKIKKSVDNGWEK